MMRQTGRKLAVLGLAAIALSALVGSGAFSSTAVDRTASINAASDSNALLAITQHADADGNLFGGGETLSLNFTETGNATHEGFINVTNQGTQSVAVWIVDVDFTSGGSGLQGDIIGDGDADNTGNITFFNREYGGSASDGSECENGVPSVEGQANAVEVTPGQTLVVGLQINASTVPADEPDLLDEMTVHANASVTGQSAVLNKVC